MGYPIKVQFSPDKMEEVHKDVFPWFDKNTIEFFPMPSGLGISVLLQRIKEDNNGWEDIRRLLGYFLEKDYLITDLYSGKVVNKSNLNEIRKNLAI